jgi:hypothetical protein
MLVQRVREPLGDGAGAEDHGRLPPSGVDAHAPNHAVADTAQQDPQQYEHVRHEHGADRRGFDDEAAHGEREQIEAQEQQGGMLSRDRPDTPLGDHHGAVRRRRPATTARGYDRVCHLEAPSYGPAWRAAARTSFTDRMAAGTLPVGRNRLRVSTGRPRATVSDRGDEARRAG